MLLHLLAGLQPDVDATIVLAQQHHFHRGIGDDGDGMGSICIKQRGLRALLCAGVRMGMSGPSSVHWGRMFIQVQGSSSMCLAWSSCT